MKGTRINALTMRVEMTRNSLTLETLKERSGVSKATLSAVRNGKTCSAETVEKIAKALNITTEELTKEANA